MSWRGIFTFFNTATLRTGAVLRLFCFPYAGGNAAIYQQSQQHAPDCVPAGTPLTVKPGALASALSCGLEGQQAAHRRIRNAVASGLDVPGQSVLECRILRDRDDHVVPTVELVE